MDQKLAKNLERNSECFLRIEEQNDFFKFEKLVELPPIFLNILIMFNFEPVFEPNVPKIVDFWFKFVNIDHILKFLNFVKFL